MPTVLVVDDQPSVRTVVRYHLQNEGYESVFAEDVDEAWRLLVAERPEAVVIDLKLRSRDGWGLVRKIRDDPRFYALPVVILTGILEPEIIERAKAMRCDYLSKPFAASALLSKIQSGLEQAPAPVAAAHPQSMRLDTVQVQVVLLLDQFRIEGWIHLPPEAPRFSDAWESVVRDQRTFIPVTEARVRSLESEHILASPAFLQVNKGDVRAVYPSSAFGTPPPDAAGGSAYPPA